MSPREPIKLADFGFNDFLDAICVICIALVLVVWMAAAGVR